MEPKQTVNVQCYSQQLRRLKEVNLEKRIGPGHGKRKIILLHYSICPYVAMETQNIIFELGSEVMPDSAYSPDLTPSDYHLFCSLEHSLREQSFTSWQDVENLLASFFV